MKKTWVWSQGQEDPLEKEVATHSCFLAWRIPQTEEPGGILSLGLQRLGHYLAIEHTCEHSLLTPAPYAVRHLLVPFPA